MQTRQMNLRSKPRWLAGIALIAGLGLAACSSGAGTPAQTSPVSPATVPASNTVPAPPSTQAKAASPIAAASPTSASAKVASPASASPTSVSAKVASPAAVSPVAVLAVPKLNLNTATSEQFLKIPNVGDRMLREFLEYRPYTSILQFRREIGKYNIPADQIAAYEQFVYVPVSPNNADLETLRQLPGVDAAIAGQLIAGRPYASVDAFLTKLGQSVSADQVAAARSYLTTP